MAHRLSLHELYELVWSEPKKFLPSSALQTSSSVKRVVGPIFRFLSPGTGRDSRPGSL